MNNRQKVLSSNPYYQIGLIATAIAQLELIINLLTRDLIGCETGISQIILRNFPLGRRLDLLSKLTSEVIENEDISTRMNDAIKKLKELITKRNEAIHAIWMLTNEPDTVARLRVFQQNGEEPTQTFSPDDLNSIATDAMKMFNDLLELQSDIEKEGLHS